LVAAFNDDIARIMADYYPLLEKAISGLSSNTLETRHAIYDRARSALLRQLASIDPPVAQAIVDRELGALEQVFTRLEMENLQHDDLPLKPFKDDIAPPNESIAPLPTASPQRQRPQVSAIKRDDAKSRKPLIAVGLAVASVVAVTLATLAFLKRDVPHATVQPQLETVQPATPQTQNAASANNASKASDRVNAPATSGGATAPASPSPVAPATPSTAPTQAATTAPAPTPPTAPVAAPLAIGVANRAVFLVQNSDKPDDVSVRQGSVVWRNEIVSSAQSQTSDRSIKASIDIPEAKLQMEVTILRNRDTAFPASHTIQVKSSPQVNSEAGAMQGVTTFEFRQSENQTGYAIAGQGIAVVDNLFLIALSQVEPALSRNIEMMKSRPYVYFEFPMSNGKRAAILMDKGISGQQVFDTAFNSW
jgi:cytoskeletal protein RodZ